MNIDAGDFKHEPHFFKFLMKNLLDYVDDQPLPQLNQGVHYLYPIVLKDKLVPHVVDLDEGERGPGA